MTTYFTAPDGHGDDTLWVRYDEPADLPANPLPVIRRSDLGPMADHWDEIVARVTAGNLSATERWALDRAAPPAETFNAITDWREPVPGWETVTYKTLGSALVTREYTVPKGQ